MSTSLERLVALVQRDLGGDEVRIADGAAAAAAAPGATEIAAPLGPGRGQIVVSFRAAPADIEARQRRLHMLVRSFQGTFGEARPPEPQSPAARLRAELEGLAARAHAVDALVIDADSPIVWGASEELPSEEVDEPSNVVFLGDAPRDAGADGERAAPAQEPEPIALRALSAVRDLARAAGLHRGGHLRTTVRDEGFGFLARSFADIYVIVLVYDGLFDELGAEREVALSLPLLERLVVALPPLDPGPLAGVARPRRGRRR